MLTIFVKNERCTRHCAGVKFDLQVSNRLTHGMHFSPILPVSRLRNQWPFCIKGGGEDRVEESRKLFSNLFRIGSARKRLWEMLIVTYEVRVSVSMAQI